MYSILLLASFASAADIHDSTAIVVGGRALGALPLASVGATGAYSANVGLEWKNGHELALRFSYVNDPPETIFGTPAWGAGPVVAWQKHFQAGPRFDLSLGGAAGLMAGPDKYTGRNSVLPTLQVSGGARVLLGDLEGSPMFIEGDVCAIVTLLAPCAAVGVGVLLPAGS